MCIVGIRVQRLPAVWEYPQCRLGWDLQHKLGALGLRPRQMWLQWQMVLSGGEWAKVMGFHCCDKTFGAGVAAMVPTCFGLRLQSGSRKSVIGRKLCQTSFSDGWASSLTPQICSHPG